MLRSYVHWVQSKKGKAVTLIGFGLTSLFLGWNLPFIEFDFEFEKFFPRNDPDSKAYKAHKNQFGHDNDFLLLILHAEDGIFNHGFLNKATAFEQRIQELDGVQKVFSPLSQKHLVNGPTGLLAFPLLHTYQPHRLPSDSIRIFNNPLYAASFTSDRKSMGIYVAHVHFEDQNKGTELVDQMGSLSDEYHLNVRTVGKLTAQNVFIEFIQKDFGQYLLGSLILSFVLLLLLFRSLKASILPFLISLFSLLWLFGLMGLLEIKINLLSSLLPPILFFVSMSDAVHLMNALHKTKQEGSKRLSSAVQIVWIPTLLTSVTTAIGFLSLLRINTQPIQSLGVFAAIGILTAFIITFTLGLVLAGSYQREKKELFIYLPTSFVPFLIHHQRKFLVLILLLISLLIPGIFQLKVNAFLLDNLPETSQVRKDFEYADKFLGGSKPYEVRVEAKEPLSIWDKEVLDEVEKIAKYLRNEYPIARVQSPSTVLAYMNQANNGGLNSYYQYPENPKDYQRARALLRRASPDGFRSLVAEDENVARIVGFFPELGSYETELRNNQLLEYLSVNIDTTRIDYRLTGTTYLIDKSHKLLSFNLIKGLLTAVLMIGIVLGLYFRSWKLIAISLIPNLIPLLMVAGVLGWTGIALKMTTSIIFTIAFGIAVDDTIHIMSYYLKNNEADREESLQKTFHHAGSAMLITSIIVIAGFSLFLLSDFGATFYLGLFVCLSLLVALVIDLTLLPILLLSIKKKK